MIRVVIADDEAIVRDGLEAIVASSPEFEVVATAANGAEAVDAARRTDPHVVLMDVRMPVIDGIEATRQLLTRPSSPRVLVLTTLQTDDVVYEALRAGASGFLLKSCAREQLWAGIRTVAAGEALLDPAVTRRLIETHFTRPGGASHSRRSLELTDRQRDVVLLLAQGKSNKEIAEALFLAETTVKSHLSDVLTHNRLRDRTQLVVAAYESGLVGDR